MMNPIQMIQMLRGGGNPQAMIQQMMNSPQAANNPVMQNMLSMAQKGDVQGIEQIGRNMARERGVDFDQAFAQFRSQFGMK